MRTAKVAKILGIPLAAVLLFSMAACGSATKYIEISNKDAAKADEQIKFRIYTQYSIDDEKQPYDYAVAAMKKSMPNVSLELEIEDQDDNYKIKTYAAAGNMPDIFAVTPDLIGVFKKSDNILQLDKYIREYGVEDKLNEASQPLLKDADGHTYAMPNVGQWAATLYINRELFEKNNIKVPGNYEELLEAVRAFNRLNIIPLAINAKEKWPAVQLFDMLATRTEPSGVTGLDAGRTRITDDAYKKAAARLIELAKAGLVSRDAFYTSTDQALTQLYTGKAAMFISGAWAASYIGASENLGSKADILYSVPFAGKSEAEGTGWNMSGGGFNQGFAVSTSCENKDVAGKFVVQFGLAFAEGRVIKRGDPNPIMKNPPAPEAGYNAIQKKYLADSPRFKTMTVFPWGISDAQMKTALEDGCQSLLTGQYTVEEFITDIENATK